MCFPVGFLVKAPIPWNIHVNIRDKIYLLGLPRISGVYVLAVGENTTLRNLGIKLLFTVRVMGSFPTQGKTKIK